MSTGANPGAASPGAAGLPLPGMNHELRRQENEQLLGKDLSLRMHLPSGEVKEMQVKESNEVGYVKLLFAQQNAVEARDIQLFFNGKQLIDPMSLCDHQGVAPPGIDVEVRFTNKK